MTNILLPRVPGPLCGIWKVDIWAKLYAYLWNIVMFLSAVWPLILTAPIHYRGSIGEQVM